MVATYLAEPPPGPQDAVGELGMGVSHLQGIVHLLCWGLKIGKVRKSRLGFRSVIEPVSQS
jgi:hypothetical protein